MTRFPVASSKIIKVNKDQTCETEDLLATEEPLEIRLNFGPPDDRIQKSISVTMRTPGNDFELALGFLFTEGIIHRINQITQLKYCTDSKNDEQNIVKVELTPDVQVDLKKLQRNFYTSSSCGVCGKSSIDAIATVNKSNAIESEFIVDQELILSLPRQLKMKQQLFEHTGGLHAASLFNGDGELLLIREDVGRHNALDKLIGAAFYSGQLPLDRQVLLLSGRASFELIQKAVMAGITIVAAVGAASSLAVETAKQFNVTLIGFLRDERFNIYSGENRISISQLKGADSAL